MASLTMQSAKLPQNKSTVWISIHTANLVMGLLAVDSKLGFVD